MDMRNQVSAAQLVVPCDDLDTAVRYYTEQLGFRLDMIMPADAPRVAVVSGFGIALRLERRSASNDTNAQAMPICLRLQRTQMPSGVSQDGNFTAPGNIVIEPVDEQSLDVAMPVVETAIIKDANGSNEWIAGRAGMQYRDLIPDRVGGRVIASQIRIERGGPVDDYVHYHKVGLQLIYCRRGWVRVVYEDQGPPFVMQPGDCVLQPPMIRHRVLESSAGLEVIELGIPAEHETWRDHELLLPTATAASQREFGGQRFVRHIASDANWQNGDGRAAIFRDIGIVAATNGMASARVFRLNGSANATASITLSPRGFRFLFVMDGAVQLDSLGEQPSTLSTDDVCVLASNRHYSLSASSSVELLDICIPPA